MFGKDIRAVLVVSCQKVFFEAHGGHDYYHYGPIIAGPGGTANSSGYGFYGNRPATCDMDLAVSSSTKELPPSVSKDKTDNTEVVITDRVYEQGYLKAILEGLFTSAGLV